MADVLTIREAVRRSKEEGMPISEYTLRQWIKAGAVPVRQAGTKMLIFYPNLVRYLRCEDGASNTQPAATSAGIRRINV